VDDTLVEEHYRTSHATGAQAALAAYLSGYLNHGIRDELSRLDLPVLLAWGRRSVNPSVETADLWLRHLPAANLDVLERCGTLPHAESASELSQKLEHFLARNED
jgi:pimeloyl-ACP methyl ester carboxylesterase